MPAYMSRLTVALSLLLASALKVNAFQTAPAFAPRRAKALARSGPLQAIFIDDLTSAYSYGMANYYLATQSMTGGVLCGVGDAVAQVQERLSEESNKARNDISIDTSRIFRFALKGLVGGVIWSNWYGMVDGLSLSLSNQVLERMSGGSSDVFGEGIHRVAQTVSAILLEQFVACPLIYSLWDIPFPMIMSGAPVESVPGQVKQKIGPLLMENAKVWSLLNVVIYNLPVQYRLPTMSVADIFWQSVIASVAAEATAEASAEQDLYVNERVVTVQTKDQQTNRKGPARLIE